MRLRLQGCASVSRDGVTAGWPGPWQVAIDWRGINLTHGNEGVGEACSSPVNTGNPVASDVDKPQRLE